MKQAPPTFLYAQSGGVTPVINTSAQAAFAIARTARRVRRLFAGRDGILGILNEELIDVGAEDQRQLKRLRHTPGGAFGSCRLKLPSPAIDSRPYQRLAEVFAAHNVRWFLYNGGNDSQDTTAKIAAHCAAQGLPVTCVGVPKTIDNDLAATDCCPGFGSVAKYVATTVAETALDVASMARTSTKLFVLEVMGRNAGWIAAAGGLAAAPKGPVLLLLPEIPFRPQLFLRTVKERIARHGYCVVVCSEGVRTAAGKFLSERGSKDSFGHAQLGGVASVIADLCRAKLGVKYHWALADYMQRAARHLASATDLEQAAAVGREAARLALAGQGQVMAAIVRLSDRPYRWVIKPVPLSKVANRERCLPRNYISKDGFFITQSCRRYLVPLIVGEEPPPFADGLPVHAQLRLKIAPKKLPQWRPGKSCGPAATRTARTASG